MNSAQLDKVLSQPGPPPNLYVAIEPLKVKLLLESTKNYYITTVKNW